MNVIRHVPIPEKAQSLILNHMLSVYDEYKLEIILPKLVEVFLENTSLSESSQLFCIKNEFCLIQLTVNKNLYDSAQLALANSANWWIRFHLSTNYSISRKIRSKLENDPLVQRYSEKGIVKNDEGL